MIRLLLDNINSDYSPKTDFSMAVKWFNEYKVRDKTLLLRALLCFGDCAKHISGDKYNLFDFDFIRNHEVFTKFEEYVNEKSPKDLISIIQTHLKLEKIKKDYMYFFIKYPEVIEFCKEGNFLWHEESKGQLIFLLETDRYTKYKAVELYTFVLSLYLKEKLNLVFYPDYEAVYLSFKYADDGYVLIDNIDDAEFQINIENIEGKTINYKLVAYSRGNAKTIKYLSDYKWIKNDEGNYERLGTSRLITLGENFEENFSNLILALEKLLKNGLGIKLQ
jgi:hypothetical protein